jgi:glycosyltransferase involved in cell wall biosynthesis
VRILHLADRLSDRGGADIHLLGVVAGQRQDHDVHAWAGRIETSPGVPAEVVATLGSRTEQSLEDLAARVSALRPDVVHLHNVMNPAVLRWAADRGAVATVQDHRAFCPGQGKWTLAGERCSEPMSSALCRGCFEDDRYFGEMVALTHARREALAQLRGVVVLSRYMADELTAVGIEARRIHVVPPFVVGLPAGTSSAEERTCGVVVGRLVRAKGLDDVLRAWELAGLGLPLLFVGTGTERARLEAAGHAVTGWLDRPSLFATLRRAQVLVMAPRWQEPFGIAGLEALAAGVPVAAWDSGGIREWHPGGPGLAPYGDVAALARAIRSVVGGAAVLPAGFEAGLLMARLEGVYRGA